MLRSAARWNGRQMPDKWWDGLDEEGGAPAAPARTYNFLDLVRTPRLRRISLSIFACWPIVSMVYYGVSMNSSFLGGSIYTTFIFGGLIEIPAVLCALVLLDRVGRKPTLAGGFIIASLCMISNLLAGSDGMYF